MIFRSSQTHQRHQQDGLLLLQIDGLSRYQFERALRSGRMPFLKRLLNRDGYQLKSFYPGLPSCTPAVQAELHYGKPCATPAFSFFDRKTGSEVRMYDAEWANRISEESQKTGDGLLRGGSSYANIYTGGADKAKFCGEVNTFAHWSHELSPIRLIGKAVKYPRAAFRILKLLAAEVGIGIYDAARGIIERGEFMQELKFMPARLGVAIALREAICSEVTDDVRGGLPIIHANFFGYDEAAHRRGPQSRFAHWSLKGIDQSIKRLVKAAGKAKSRNYEIVVFSDHGQEHTIPYHELTGTDLKSAIAQSLSPISEYRFTNDDPIQAAMERATSYFHEEGNQAAPGSHEHELHLQALGPVAHLTFCPPPQAEQKAVFAREICKRNQVPYILFLDTKGNIVCVTESEQGDLDLLETQLLKRGHEFPKDAIADLATLVNSEYAGDLVLLGWRSEQKPITFADEHGAHAGPGAEECRGFVMLPKSISYAKDWLRPLDLRNLALQHLGRKKTLPTQKQLAKKPHTLRVLSYNVHGGVGVDRRRNNDRLAAVIRESKADVVCFQEAFEGVDPSRISLRNSVEAAWETAHLHYEFLPLHQNSEYRFGLAIASKLPFSVRKSEGFALTHSRTANREPRGAIWVEVPEDSPSGSIHIVNTHFGLQTLERRLQAQTLIGDDWLKDTPDDGRVIICGDLNTGPKGPAYQTIARHYADSFLVAENGRPAPSFLSWAPIRRIDHIFATPNLSVSTAGVHRSPLSRWASDHLPVFADFQPKTA